MKPQLTPNSSLTDYIRLSRIWKSKPDIQLPLRFKFWFFLIWNWPTDLYYIAFESFVVSQKYKNSIEHAADLLLRIYNPKRFKWLYKRLIQAMPLKLILPLYEHYLTEFVKIESKLKEQSELYKKTEEMKHDMTEFGYSNISFLLSGNNRQVVDWIEKQPMIYIITEYRREIVLRENQRPKSKK